MSAINRSPDSPAYMYPLAMQRVRTSSLPDPRFVLAWFEVWDKEEMGWDCKDPIVVTLTRGIEYFLNHRMAGWRGGEQGSLGDVLKITSIKEK